MKAIDDITRTELDALISAADLDFGFDSRPLAAGEQGAGIFASADDEVPPFDDSVFDVADKPSWLVEAGF